MTKKLQTNGMSVVEVDDAPEADPMAEFLGEAGAFLDRAAIRTADAENLRGAPIYRMALRVPASLGGHDKIPSTEISTGKVNELILSKVLTATADYERRVVWMRFEHPQGVSFGCTPFENVAWWIYGSESPQG